MHRIDGLDHVGNMFDEGDPMVPRLPTKLTPNWFNAVQEELCNVVEGAGITLAASGAADTARNQLLAAIDKLSPAKAACTVSCDGSGGVTLVGTTRNVASVSIQAAGGGLPARVRVTFTTAVPTPIACNVTNERQPSVMTLPTLLITPIVQEKTTTHVDFAIRTYNGGGGGASDFDTVNVSTLSQRYTVLVVGS